MNLHIDTFFFVSIIYLLSQLLAIKKLDSDGSQGIREFVVEMMTLSLVDHPNLVKLVGYCVEAGQKLLVYEYMSLGSLEGHLHGILFS